jgi:hypothetical protein
MRVGRRGSAAIRFEPTRARETLLALPRRRRFTAHLGSQFRWVPPAAVSRSNVSQGRPSRRQPPGVATQRDRVERRRDGRGGLHTGRIRFQSLRLVGPSDIITESICKKTGRAAGSGDNAEVPRPANIFVFARSADPLDLAAL